MTPRHKKPGNDDLPRNLTQNGDYYQYKHPFTGKKFSFGSNRQAAIQAAKRLNATLNYAQEDRLFDRVMGLSQFTLAAVIDLYKTDRLPEKRLKPSTLENIEYKLAKYKRDLGHRDVRHIIAPDIKNYLSSLTVSAYVKHRQLLIELFEFAIEDGLIKTNPAAATRRKVERKQRQRLTLDGYNKIYEIAPEWFQIAMDAALYSLQSRVDLTRIRLDGLKDGVLYLVRQKVEKHEHARLAIEVQGGLAAVFERSRLSAVPSRLSAVPAPFLIHRHPGRKQVKPVTLTRTFARLRDKCGYWDCEPRERPSFHEIRSLGAHLYEKAGYPPEYVQALMAHGDVKMTVYYQSGHEEKWVKCSAGLTVKQKGES